MKKSKHKNLRRVDVQVAILTAVMVVLSGIVIYLISYALTYSDMIKSLTDRVNSIYNYIERDMDKTTFSNLNTPKDMSKESYIETCSLFERIRRATGVQYLYTAKRNDAGELIYVIDGLERSAPDIRYPGDLIETEIQDHLNRALMGEAIYPDEITHTEWGDIFITYLPVHANDDRDKVIGVIGIEFEAESQNATYRNLRLLAPLVISLSCIVSAIFSVYFFRRISNPAFQDLANTDYLTKLKNRNAYELDTKNMCAMGTAQGCALILADLNGLKLTNDTKGHEEGDSYLKAMAEALRDACSGSEIIYRVGGDEFIVIIRRATDETAQNYLTNLSESFDARREGLMSHCSYSIGYSIVESNDLNVFDRAYAKADAQMYNNKKKYYEKMKT